MELTTGILKTAHNVYKVNKGSLYRTLIYTIGHFLIAITVLMTISSVSFVVV